MEIRRLRGRTGRTGGREKSRLDLDDQRHSEGMSQSFGSAAEPSHAFCGGSSKSGTKSGVDPCGLPSRWPITTEIFERSPYRETANFNAETDAESSVETSTR